MAAPRAEEVYDWADAVELVMETRPVSYGWTPSEVARKAGLSTEQAREALQWMVREVTLTSDDRGSWTHYYRRH